MPAQKVWKLIECSAYIYIYIYIYILLIIWHEQTAIKFASKTLFIWCYRSTQFFSHFETLEITTLTWVCIKENVLNLTYRWHTAKYKRTNWSPKICTWFFTSLLLDTYFREENILVCSIFLLLPKLLKTHYKKMYIAHNLLISQLIFSW